VTEQPTAATPERAPSPQTLESADSVPTTSRWAISRGRLFMLLAIFLPAVASLLAPMASQDIAYQIRTGQLMLDSGRLIDTDPFTFTVAGESWLNQQWGASLLLGAGYDAVGWAGLLLLRAVLIGLTFALVYAACRGAGANHIVSAITTLGMFLVAMSNLGLRSQTFGLLCFAAVVAILVYRRKHPLLLWLIPLVMIGWGNTHGSFFIGWAAIGVAALEDLAARSRLAVVTVVVGVLSVLATLIGPWGVAMWQYVIDLSTNPLIPELVTEWQASTLKDPTGLFFYLSVAIVVLLLVLRGRAISWWQLAWLAGLVVIGMMAVRGVAWWAIGAAPVVALLASGLAIRDRRLGDPELDAPRGVGYTAIASVLVLLVVVALPVWRPIDRVYGPQGVVRDAPRGVTEGLLAQAAASDRLLAEQTWGSWLEFAVPGLPLMVDSRIELFDRAIWGDYLHVVNARADWAEILDRWEVTLVAIAPDAQLRPFLDADPGWLLQFEDDEGAIYRRG
jgi:hypothetical protein